VVAPVERHALAREQAADDLECFLEPSDLVVERNAERPELGLVPTGAEAEDEPAAGHLVDRRRHACDEPGPVKRRRRDERTERHALGRRGERRQHRPHVPRASLPPFVAVEHVIPEPHRIETARLGRPCDGDQLPPANHPLDLRQLNADCQRIAQRAHARIL
jgi:hypothetical protein